MRLLTRDTSGQICVTEDEAEDKLPPYAILSHTWSTAEEEVKLQDINDGSATNKPGYAKVMFCLEQAERDGVQHCWVDTCCINKTDSTELAKSIVSMFRWYRNARKCYVYLSDVPAKLDPLSDTDLVDRLRTSRWFYRGWTLQELIAPADVVLFNSKYEQLGTKISLAREIAAVTRMPIDAILCSSFDHFTTQERFSWQIGRETREPEDMAYSMFGLFDVSMPIIYGETYERAQQRLRAKIEKASKGFHLDKFNLSPNLNHLVQVHDFVGRKEELAVMCEALRGDGSRRFVTIHGLGGMGKSQLALQYATCYKDMYTAILWINIDSRDTAAASFMKVAEHIQSQPVGTALNVDVTASPNKVIKAVTTWLSHPHNTRWLMIFDNYDNPMLTSGSTDLAEKADIREFLPSAHQGSVIVTTRSGHVNLGRVIHLQKLVHESEGMEILAHTSARNDLLKDPFAKTLAQELDGLPLALATAGAYLSQSNMSLQRYMHLYRTSWAKLQRSSSGLNTYEDRKLYSTWQITFDRIQESSPLAANFLRLSAYFGSEDIWFQLIQHDGEQVAPSTPSWIAELVRDELDFEAVVQTLCSYSLLEKANSPNQSTQSRGYSMHKCVHAWAKSVLEAAGDQELAHYVLSCIAALVPMEREKEFWITQRRLVYHASICASQEERYDKWSERSGIWHKIGTLYSEQYRFEEAEVMYHRALSRNSTAVEDDTSTLRTINNLANLYLQQGKLSEAENLMRRAMNGHEKTLGTEHRLTLGSVRNLGVIFELQGRTKEAETMFRRSLRGVEALGTMDVDTPSTASSACNIGNLYLRQGRLDEAEAMLQRALHNSTQVRGADDHLTLGITCNLGLLYTKQRKFEKAEEMLDGARIRAEQSFGADNPLTLEIVHNLGELNVNRGRLYEAEAMFRLALAGREEKLGADALDTLETVYHYGLLNLKSGQLRDAEAMLKRVLIGYQKTLGMEHISFLETAGSLGRTFAEQGRMDEAETMCRRALAGYEMDVTAHAVAIHEIEQVISLVEFRRASDASKRTEREHRDD